MKFPPIYIIKMPGSTRNPRLIQSLDKLGLEYKIQEAVVGASLRSTEINDLVDLKSCFARLGYNMSKNLIGCGLSHKKIFLEAFNSKHEWILVFEEDAQLVNFEIVEIEKALILSGDAPTVIQLFTRAARLIDKNSLIELGDNNRMLFDFAPRLIGFGASAYLMNREAINIALKEYKLDGPPDWPSWATEVRFRGIYPWMINENNEGSTIPDNQINTGRYLLRRLMQITGVHFLIYRNQYKNPKSYLNEEIKPYIYYLKWRVKGSKYYLNDENGLQI